ncbi:MAG: hypothetical protein J6B64_04840 [Bacilli bacterium]|nr:hypothetical protein [Bacilli bacterium]
MFDKNLLGNNIIDIDKNLLAQTISKIDLFFAKFGVNIDYDNSRELFENLKIVDVQGKQNYVVYYDETSNTIKQNFENPDFSPKKYEAELVESLLSVLSQKFNFEEDRYDKGLLSRDTNLRFHGFALNDMLKAYIGTLITGYNKETSVKDFYLDSPKDYETIPDRAIHDFCEVFGAEFLLKSFINGDGSELFYKVGKILGSEESAVELYDSIDNYKNDSISNRRKYDMNMEVLKVNKLENKHKM